MKMHSRLLITTTVFALLIITASMAVAWAQQKTAAGPKAGLPVLVTSCGQSPGPERIKIFLNNLKLDFTYKLDATAADLAKGPFKSVIIVTGASLKGMGAAGVSIDDELARAKALIAAAKKQNIIVIGAHIEGMSRRAQGASPGDNTDEQTIDAVCPLSSLLLVKKEGDEDGRFSTISRSKNIPMISFDKNLDLQNVLKELFGK